MNSITDHSENLLDIIEKAYAYGEGENKKQRFSPCRIRFRGRYIWTNTHSVWKRVGDAKNALRNLIEELVTYRFPRWDSDIDKNKIYEDLLKEVVFEPVSVDWALRHR